MIEIIAGTNRPQSNSLRVANLVQSMYNECGAETRILSLEEMPQEIFDPASYARKPDSFEPLAQRVVQAEGLHIITPEYNGSFPGVLKYFIDMLPFPISFQHKCCAFTGVAAGVWGGFRSVEQLQMIFGYRNAYVLPERVWIPGINQKWQGEDDSLDPATMELLNNQVREFTAFIARNRE